MKAQGDLLRLQLSALHQRIKYIEAAQLDLHHMLIGKHVPQHIVGHPTGHQDIRIPVLGKHIGSPEDIGRLNLHIVIRGQFIHYVFKYLL